MKQPPELMTPKMASTIAPFVLTCVIILGALALNCSSALAQTPTQTPAAGGVVAAEPRFRLVRSVSGTKIHEESGRFAVDDPRTMFYVPADQQVVVYFTWEGPAGAHHFEGVWKSPAGKAVLISGFDYTSDQPRFGGYFKMLLTEAPTPGVWTLEARIDGESAGSHTFQVLAALRPDDAVSNRHILNRAEIYDRASAATVSIENVDQKGARRFVGSGFLISPGRVLTAFEVIESATRVRVLSQGKLIEVTEVQAWNRRQGWAILKAPVEGPPLPSASAAIGITDRCFFLDAAAENNRVLTETFLIGTRELGAAGQRLNIGETFDRRAVGSPLINDYGEVIGIIGGSLLGGAFPGDSIYGSRNATLGAVSRGGLAIPISLVNESSGSPTTIGQLAATGKFMPTLAAAQTILSGALSRGLNRKADPPRVVEERYEFTRADQQVVVFITWLPEVKRKGVPALHVFDLDNRLIFENAGKKKITVNTNKLSYSGWEMDVSTLPPGIYRVDVLLDADTVWRTFFRVIE
jgi:trypsin-like peptidase